MDVPLKTQKENEERVAEEYLSSLSDLNCNSKPLINMLTMLAEENIEYAAVIVKVVEQHIDKVSPDIKLPILYLIDSIVKNVKSTYVQLFSQCIVNIFCGVFEKVNEKIRERMYALRQTWNEVFSPQKLYALDVKVKRMDINWPITAKQPMQPSIHVNPNFLKNVNSAQTMPSDMEEILHAKTRELLELKKRKLELELEATKKHLEEQEKQLSKATESVIGPSVEVLLPPGNEVGAGLPAVGPRPQQMPNLIPPGNLHRQQQIIGNQHPTGIGMRPPGMFQQFRNPRPQQPHMAPPGSMNMPQTFPINNAPGNKAKVHPVTPSLLNSVRQRDPRLARQQQQQQQHQQHTQIPLHPAQLGRGPQMPDDPRNNDISSGKSNNNKSYVRNVGGTMGPGGGGGGGVGTTAAAGSFENKSTRHTSISNRGSSMGRSAGRSSKNSFRDKERDRKRNSAYSSQPNSGIGGSTSVDGRRKPTALSLPANQKPKCNDKDAFEIAPLSLAFKRKSSSPASSPKKTKDSKRSPKFRNADRNKNRSRSPSPEATSVLKDTDLRIRQKTSPDKRIKLSSSTSPKRETTDTNMEKERKSLIATAVNAVAATVIAKDLDKNVEDDILVSMAMLPGKDVDLRQLTVSSSALTAINRTIIVSSSQASANVATSSTSSPKVSFKIQKPFNILEKSTENLSTVTNNVPKEVDAAVAADVADTKQLKRDPKDDNKIGTNSLRDQQKSMEMLVGNDEDEDSKKRSSAVLLDAEELLPKKKSKQTKLDTLFGTEDVDLRTVPPQILAVQQTHAAIGGIMTAPPPPVISDEQKISNLEVAKPINNKSNISSKLESENKLTVVNAAPFKKSSLDDVRAKLAKAAKYNKIGKQEKAVKEVQQRFKLADINLNEDIEDNDDKIRTIISQAQELHDCGSINDEQYTSLVKTVMSLNETSKLKEAKRRESLLIAAKRERQEDAVELDLTDVDIDRMAARDAVLKKRIPKLPKDDVVVTSIPTDSSPSPLHDLKTESKSPNYDDKSSEQRDNADKQQKLKPNKERQQRNKQSKWGERIVPQQQHQEPIITNQPVGGANTAATWHLGAAFPKRPPGFSSRVPHPPLPPLPNPNLGLPLPSPWQMGAGVVPPPFATNQVPMIRSSVPPPPQPPVVALPPIPAPPVIPKPCNSIDNPQAGVVRSITIDGLTKEIRIYDQVAIVFMELDQPREIGFQAGQRSIIINNMEPIVLRFNDGFEPITIDGEVHQVRFGFPSRELYIDDHWYEIYFGGPAVSIPLQNKFHMLKAEGPPPQVNIGALRRDLVLGKINMIVNADIIIPIFLDGKLQTFRLNDVEHTIQFADNLLTVLLDGEVAPVEYGALPKRYTLGGTTYFIRFGTLPQGVVPGKVFIKDMIYKKIEPPVDTVPVDIIPAAPIPEVKETGAVIYGEAAKSEAAVPPIPKIPQAALTNINIDELFQKLVSSGILGAATAVLPSVASPVAETKTENVTTTTTPAPPEETTQPQKDVINPIDLSKIETVKTRQVAIVEYIYSGMQCSSCGVRFPPEQTIKYSQHLDWHFRQNRRERDSTRKAHVRKWYYNQTDWLQFKEIEDGEEREKNLEILQSDIDVFDDTSSNQRSTHSPVPSCPAGPDDVDRACYVCREKFEQFYNEELEEWHMSCAIRVEEKIYHPLCYEDYKASLNPPEKPADVTVEGEAEIINADDDNATDAVIKIEADNSDEADAKMSVTIPDDDDYDDDVIVLPNEESSVTEIVDDDDEVNGYVPVNVSREDMGSVNDDKNEDKAEAKEINDTAESDVEIQEPHIPFTDLDTYEEKDLPEGDETSQVSFMNVKIKEEPKDDDDEDDGFEDVGTVVIPPDEEISIHSSEGTPTHTIASSTSGPSPITVDLPTSVTSELEQTTTTTTELADAGDASISLDGTTNLEPEDDHNLSSAGPAPAVPVASLLNKIKINITKNIISTNSSSSTTATTTTTTNSLNSNELNSNVSNSSSASPQTAISTIPVLCGGTSTTTTANISSHSRSESPASAENGGGGISAISVIGSNMNVSNISVIGSYSSSSRYHHPASNSRQQQQQTVTKTAHVTPAPTPPSAKATEKVPLAEEVIDYKLKPALEKVKLKKTKKIESGVETSGLCSIM